MTQTTIDLTEVRNAAYDLYAEWQAAHSANGATKDWPATTKEQFLNDLRTYSINEADEVQERHDHTLVILHPSLGDEAGDWTLYVVWDSFVPFGMIGGPDVKPGHGMGEHMVLAMWHVFDTRPNAIYEIDDEFDEDLGRSVPKAVWFNMPEG